MIFFGFLRGRLRSPAMWFPHVVAARMGQSQVIFARHARCAWLTTDPANLSVKAKSAIEDARKNGDGLAFSDITLLELATTRE